MMVGIEVSGRPFEKDGSVVVVFEDGTEWTPPLIPADLEKFGAAPSLPKRTKAKAKASTGNKPVNDYILETIRAKFATQGKSAPIIKVEARADRNDLSSGWRQRFQIVVRGDMTAVVAMNICATFCDCYHFMNLNQGELNFRECRDLLIEMGKNGTHDFTKGKMDWEKVSTDCKKAFPPPSRRSFTELLVIYSKYFRVWFLCIQYGVPAPDKPSYERLAG